ncbi:RHS repeat-associated core domain-containing protein [Desulfovibrio sp. OttesenSCG-928-G11]|nr:RHS repeat-associated core domain-containing protein [Desulfovibrio sp. OttesenSCG-928-G11]
MDSSYGNPYFPGKRRCILGEGAEEAQKRPLSGGESFSFQCRISAKGRVMEKIETGPLGRDVFNYEYDAAGHLTMVRKNELISEFYEFDEGGRRVLDFRAWAGGKRRLTYNYDGTLIQAGNVHLKWTDKGQLASISAAGGAVAPYSDAAGFRGFAAKHLSGQKRTNVEDGMRTSFSYGYDTRLDRALLADGTDIRYHYGNELMPVKITVNGATVAEYQWADKIRLLRYRDVRRGLTYDFAYTDKRAPVRVIISGSAVDLYQATGISAQRLELNIQTDQVDSIRALSLPDGRPVKYIEYDSFGNVISDSRTDWKFPLGFACGLHDHWTGLTRFGFRDYDPRFGRFTAKDPARDMRGDGDLWDYCIDDPVGSFDPTGLFLSPILPSGYQLSDEDKHQQPGVEAMLAETALDIALERANIPNPIGLAKSASGRRALGVIPQVAKTIDTVHGWATGTPTTTVTDGIYESYEKIGKGMEQFWDTVPGEVMKLPGAIYDGFTASGKRKK